MYGEPIQKAQEAALAFVEVMNGASYISTFPNDLSVIKYGIHSVKYASNGRGNFGHLFDLIFETMNCGLLIVLTDEVWNYPNLAIQKAHHLWDKIYIVGIGFGNADESFLKSISSIEDISRMTDLENFSQTFLNVGRVISSSSDFMAVGQ